MKFPAAVALAAITALAAVGPAAAADLRLRPQGAAAPVSAWQFRFTPYAWLLSVSGTATARNQTVDFGTTFADVIRRSDSLIGWMSAFEARKDALALYADVIYGRVKYSGDHASYRNPVPGLSFSGSLGAGGTVKFALVEAGAAYEAARWGSPASFTAVDIVGGARYWYASVDLAFAMTGAVDVSALNLERSGNLALAGSGAMQWVDPLIGVNLRHQFVPGKELRLRADIGGFGLGSDSTWQLFGTYSQEFKLGDTTLAGVLGYRVINVKRTTEGGVNTRGLDLTLHGPVVGLSFRW